MKSIDIEQHITKLLDLSESLSGHLRKREVQFLASLPFIRFEGEILEIGSFKGKSTIILAKAAEKSGTNRIFACDPLSLSCSTDPNDATKEELPEIFYNNLKTYNVKQIVNFNQMKSHDLAKSWNKPLKVLWIDGDHTYPGVLSDLMLFQDYLTPGAIVCFHDVLHGFDGPIRTFLEKVLLSDLFGDCGFCGSIGWGQFLGKTPVSSKQWKNKLSLYSKLSRMVPFVLQKNNGLKSNEHLCRFFRSLIPHRAISPVQWLKERNSYLM